MSTLRRYFCYFFMMGGLSRSESRLCEVDHQESSGAINVEQQNVTSPKAGPAARDNFLRVSLTNRGGVVFIEEGTSFILISYFYVTTTSIQLAYG